MVASRSVRALPFAAELAQLTLDEQRVLVHVAGEIPWRDLLVKTGMSADHLEGVLERLACLGAVALVEQASSIAPSEPPSSTNEPSALASPPPDRHNAEGEPVVDGEDVEADLSHRQLYAHRFAKMTLEARVASATTARDADLVALCYDADPRVISAAIDNTTFALLHARTIARHHRNARGLEMLARRAELLKDSQVHQSLMKNPQLPDGVVQRLLASKSLGEVYKLSIDHNLPDHTRSKVRAQLRKKFTIAEPEERAQIVLKTEGRVLTLLAGCTFDGKTAQILCSQSFNSTLLIQNLARFSATPPPVLTKMIQQPTVRRQPQLRAMLLRHPNMPTEVKRRM